MKIDLSGKTAIVTGSTGGIGLAIARGLVACGATVVINGRNRSAVDKAIAAVREGTPEAEVRGVSADLSTASGCNALVKAEPACDILVNNVGIYGPQDFFEIPDSEWTRFFEVNVMSGVRLSRAYMPAMLERDWGRVVFLSSESGLNIPPEMIHYGFTKTAVLAIARGLAKRAAGTGGHGEFGAPRTDIFGGCRRYAEVHGPEHWPVDRTGRAGIRQGIQAVFHHWADGDARGGRQHGRLRRLPTGLGNDRRRAAG